MFGDHAAFIIPSYAITAAVIAGLTIWIMVVYRRRKREIAELEARGVRRRSASSKAESESAGS